MAKFFENPNFPEYLKEREDFEKLQNYQGADTSMEILPHLNIDWENLRQAYERTYKPVGDLGASFSTLAVEGELQGIKVYPVDIMHMQGRENYSKILEMRMVNVRMAFAYAGGTIGLDETRTPLKLTSKPINSKEYVDRVNEAIAKAKANFIVGDLEKLPVADRFFSSTVLHDSLPKHSKDWDTFISRQLPEILRVTDMSANFYPMSIYKTSDGKLLESDALFNNPDSLKKIREAASGLGFDFQLRQASENKMLSGAPRIEKEIETRNGYFERIKK